MLYGYGRVSTTAQDTALQEDAFRRAAVDRVVTEKWSSVGARPALQRLLASLGPGDCVVVYKLDRLGRSLQDLLSVLDRIQASGATFRSLTEPIDTTTPAGRLMFSMLGAVAEFERSLIRERSIAGQLAAWERGAQRGRPRASTGRQDARVLRLWESGGYSLREIADRVGLHEATVKRIVYRVQRPGSSSLS